MKERMLVAFIHNCKDEFGRSEEAWELLQCTNHLHREGRNPWDDSIPHGLVKESDLLGVKAQEGQV